VNTLLRRRRSCSWSCGVSRLNDSGGWERLFPAGNATKAACLVVLMAIMFVVAVWGHQTMVLMQKWFAIALGIGTLILAAIVSRS
jgi:hypothetical protein